MNQSNELLPPSTRKGRLKIYLGYAAGVGKTTQMLQEAQRLKQSGMDVVSGFIETHNRTDVAALIQGLEMIPPVYRALGNQSVREMDLDTILKRKPQLVLVDEIAHSNAPESRHPKRYEDVLEILDHGIDVVTTLNIQHVESIAQKLTDSLGFPILERIPDRILQIADQVINVDLSISDLRNKIREGKIFDKNQSERALLGFFSHENLALLRKFALQETAEDQLRKIETGEFTSELTSSAADEAVMVAMSSDATNAEVLIHRGTKLSSQLSAHCYLVYVQRKQEAPEKIPTDIQRKLHLHMKLAKELGAEVVTLQGEDIAEVLVNFAQTHKVRHVFFGKPRTTPLSERIFGSVLQDFIHDSVGIDIHIVALSMTREPEPS